MKKIILVLLLGFPISVHGATYYVATNGSDSAAGSIGAPWQTPLKAWRAAQAGDTVYFRGGTYVISSTIDTKYQGYNGTSASPITFTAYTGETVLFDASGTALVPVFAIQKAYNIVDGINIKSQATFFSVGEDVAGTGFTFKNATCTMTVGYSDNAGCVYVWSGSYFITVQNNTIIGPGTATNANVAGVWADTTQHLLIKNNTISGFPSGIYFKHANTVAQTNNEYSYNYIYGCTWGIHSVANYVLMQHNLLNNGVDVFDGDDGGGSTGCNYDTFLHNTMAGGSLTLENQNGGVGPCLNNTFKDNIFKAKNNYDAYDSVQLNITSDYNLFPAGNIVYENRTNYTLNGWEAFSGLDAHSLSSAPTFAGGTSPSTIAGFALASGSLGHNSADDGTDIGANVSCVGVGNASCSGNQPPPPPPPPPPPTNNLTNECANPPAGTIWCDDFESNRVSSYFDYNLNAGSFTLTSGVGMNGSHGMRAIYVPGQSDAGYLHVAFGKNPITSNLVDGGTANYREIYWRLYVKNQAGWTGGGGDKLTRAIVFAKSDWSEAAIGHLWSGGGGTGDPNHLIIDPASGTDSSGNLVTVGYNDMTHLTWLGAQQGTTPLFDSAHVGQWHCVEAHMKLNDTGSSNGTFEFWVDGNLETQKTGMNWVGSFNTYGINSVFLENYWNATAPVVEERYLDNFVVATQRIGCGSITLPAPPAAPRGLRLQ